MPGTLFLITYALLAVRGLAFNLLLAQQRGVCRGRSAAEGAGARVTRERQRFREQFSCRSGARYVIPGIICNQNLIAFHYTKCSQQIGFAPHGPSAQCAAVAGAGHRSHLGWRQLRLTLASVHAQQARGRARGVDKCCC